MKKLICIIVLLCAVAVQADAQSSDESAEERLETMIRYANFTGCIRNYILQYFGEDATEPCENCSNCLGELKLVDVTKEGQMVLSCIVRMKANFGMTMVVDILRGSQNQRILDNKFEQLTTHGIMKMSVITMQISLI